MRVLVSQIASICTVYIDSLMLERITPAKLDQLGMWSPGLVLKTLIHKFSEILFGLKFDFSMHSLTLKPLAYEFFTQLPEPLSLC